MIEKLGLILTYSLIGFILSVLLFPHYISFLKRLKALKTIREVAADGAKAEIFNKLHGHKQGTPTAGGGMFLIIMAIMVLGSMLAQQLGFITNSLFSREETYILLFSFFGMGSIGLLDDFFNVMGRGKARGISMKLKVLAILSFSLFTAFWFTVKLGAHQINLWPIHGVLDLNLFTFSFLGSVIIFSLYPLLIFFLDLAIVNAVNITDGLDGLVGGMMVFVFMTCAVITFFYGRYLATTLLGILICTLLSFLWYNIQPAKVFMGDSGSLSLGGFTSALLYLINLKAGFFIPFAVLFAIFIIEAGSSSLQLFWKKRFKRKLFTVAPFHHLLEFKGYSESHIVMKFWMLQLLLSFITLIMFFYQYAGR